MLRTKKYMTLLASLIAISLSFCNCTDPADVSPEIDLSFQEITFNGGANNNVLIIETNIEWEATVSETWCTLGVTTGSKGVTQIKLSVTPNPTVSTRKATITFKAGTLTKEVIINQKASDLITFSQDKFSVAAAGAEISLTTQSSASSYTYTKPEWITIKSESAENNARVSIFSVVENNSILARTGLIIFTAGSFKDTVTVEQTGKDLYIAPNATGMGSTALTLAKKMYTGWNIGNTLEVPGGETGWGNPQVTQTLIDSIKAAGFNAVRIPCAWDSHIDDVNTYKINDAWLARVKEVVNYCYNNNMYVIINIHWDGGWLENNPTYAKQAAINKKQKALWEQIAAYFRDFDEHLLFAGTNEVHADYNTPTTENITVQQSFNQTFVDAVRSTGGRNHYRNLIVQSYNTNIDYAVTYLKLPTDVVSDRMMVEIHYYDPWDFCGDDTSSAKYFWGQPYSALGVSSWGQEAHVDQQFGKMKTNFVNNGYPVILGEYAPTRRSALTGSTLTNHLASRAYYLQYVTKQAKNYGLVPFYWDNGGTGNNASGIFDRPTNTTFDRQALKGIMTGAASGNYPY
ncbi:MAG: mismatch repair protein [Bacteroidetes bacterium]|nr:mismatch repair protein [Bacteroidota bacterium]